MRSAESKDSWGKTAQQPLAAYGFVSLGLVRRRIIGMALDSTDAGIKPGMMLLADFTVRNVRNVVRVSNTYLKVNLVNGNGSMAAVLMTVGLQGTDYSEVIDGLRVDDRLSVTAISGATVNSVQG